MAIVAATEAICSGVALSVFWPIAAEPTAIASFICFGTVLTLAAGRSGCSLKPNFSAVASSFLAPTLAPSGPKTELQECAKELTSVPPHVSSHALRSLTPESVADVRAG